MKVKSKKQRNICKELFELCGIPEFEENEENTDNSDVRVYVERTLTL